MAGVQPGVSKVSDAPPKNAVTQAFDAKTKKADVDRKVSTSARVLSSLYALH